MIAWLALAGAVALETVATLTLRVVSREVRVLPLVLVVLGYAGAFTLMTVSLRSLNVGIVYAVWSGVGTAAVAVIAAVVFRETLTPAAVVGIALIITGVVVLSLSGAHHA
ncbi:DMT family transporter [Allokutzneria albata]|uniref:Small multidrug resistance pump n=1 Tax=Allokutzneria albata TaxID=211114 RepID=A0A1G9S368_ALLAB|nr:SMR family transporter [Allokutzneria albata]SDM29861.1 small multidrug resistance pump [Allokutzneria albata]